MQPEGAGALWRPLCFGGVPATYKLAPVNKGPFLIFAAFAVFCVVLIPLKAISSKGGESAAPVQVEPQDEDGKDLFANNCGPCHTLAAAGSDGVVGPNLDQLLAPGGTANYEGSYGRALSAITCGFGNGRMPAGIIQGENAKEVAAFVGAYAGQAGDTSEPLVDTDDLEEAPRGDPPKPAPAPATRPKPPQTRAEPARRPLGGGGGLA